MTIEDLDDILREIETKSISHPNLTRVWIEYLNIKKQKLEMAITEAKYMLNQIETIDDMSWNAIMCLASFSETMREHTT